MKAIQLLQSVGLTKYEAEAYDALLREGALTGYELGKRSAVPLPRAYDVLRRLTKRGLALVQPGEPPQYRAADPALFIDQLRTTMNATLEELARLLSGPPASEMSQEFWVVQTRSNILAHAASMLRAAERSVHVLTPQVRSPEVDDMLALARATSHREVFLSQGAPATLDPLAVVVDDSEALVGTISPPDRCQAIVSANPALVGAVRAYTRTERGAQVMSRGHAPAWPDEQPRDWLTWEEEKQRRLLRQGRSVA